MKVKRIPHLPYCCWLQANVVRDQGDRYCLQDFMAKKGESLKKQYKKLTLKDKEGLMRDIKTVKEEHMKICRANPKVVLKDVNSTFDSMEKEVSYHAIPCWRFLWTFPWQWAAICSHTGVEGFYVVVRGCVEDNNEPKIFFSDKALRFIKEVLETDPQQLMLKLKAWCVSRLGESNILWSNVNSKLTRYRQGADDYKGNVPSKDNHQMSQANPREAS